MALFQLASDTASTVRASFEKAGELLVDYNILVVAEFCVKITPNQYEQWTRRDKSKAYNYKLPFSVAIALCRIVRSFPDRPPASYLALHEILVVKLYDSGININTYTPK